VPSAILRRNETRRDDGRQFSGLNQFYKIRCTIHECVTQPTQSIWNLEAKSAIPVPAAASRARTTALPLAHKARHFLLEQIIQVQVGGVLADLMTPSCFFRSKRRSANPADEWSSSVKLRGLFSPPRVES